MKTERPALEVMEEAVHLLRCAPPGPLLAYYIGSAPFVLGFLFFWADMSASAFARARVVWFSALMAVLYLWMKCWQTVFAAGLRRELTGGVESGWSSGRVASLVKTQLVFQPAGLVLIPLSLVVAVPFPWVFAFFQGVSVQEWGESRDAGGALRKAGGQAAAWGGQNHAVLALLALLAGVVFVNTGAFLLFLPGFLKTLTGGEFLFTRDYHAVFNTTFLAIVAGITYLCVDPMVKAVYAVRLFYIESMGSGDDLRLELRRIVSNKPVLVLLLLAMMARPSPLRAAGEEAARVAPQSSLSASSSEPSMDPARLDSALRRVLRREEFAWRLPRDSQSQTKERRGFLAQFLHDILDGIARAWRWLRELVVSWFRPTDEIPASGGGGKFGGAALDWLLVLALLAGASALGVWLWRWLSRRRGPGVGAIQAVSAQAAPELRDERVLPDRLPSDQWMRLALEMAAAGNPRLALRAFYLASLAHLSARELLRIAPFKSNREYMIELQRRTKATPALAPVFRENVEEFDRVWYGGYPVDEGTLARFEANTRALCS